MYSFFILVGLLAFFVGIFWLILNLFRKRPKKRASLIIAGGFIFMIIGGIMAPAPTESEIAAREMELAAEKEEKEAEVAAEELAKETAKEEEAEKQAVAAAEEAAKEKEKEDKALEEKQAAEVLAAEKKKEDEVKAAEKKKADADKVATDKKAKEAKAAAEKKEKADKAASKKAKAEKKLAAEKEYYLNEVKSKVDTQMGMYDEAWDSLWVTTFNGVSNGSTDVYTAYDNMKQLQQRYETLQNSIPAIPSEGLSKENKENLSDFQKEMVAASRWRASAAEKAQDMFDAGTFSPSEMDEVKSDVEVADGKMLSAIVSLTSLEMELGIERE